MFYTLKDRLNRLHFAWACRHIYDTPPVKLSSEEPVAVLTQLQHKDVILFLIAIKSFARQVPLREVFILDDGSLTHKDRNTLKRHLTPLKFLSLGEFQDPHCPTGGTWERLLAIATLNQDRYVIQLDSDTLTLDSLDEVHQHIQTHTPFTLGTWDNQTIEPMRVNAERVQKKIKDPAAAHVQMAAEAAFLQVPQVDDLKYVRGCSGFAGFPADMVKRDFIIDFSKSMENILGDKWHEWGSEQVMSNVVIANIPNATVLPHPKYSDCIKMNHDTHFIHFVGSCRFSKKIYPNTSISIIDKLK